MKLVLSLLTLPQLLLKAAFELAIGAVFAVLILLATPFWLLEMCFTKNALSSARVAALKDCESPWDWMFSRVDPKGSTPQLVFVRLWGLEFRYR